LLECYRRAQEARRFADTATTPAEKADFLEVERRWLSLAREVIPRSLKSTSAA
jgi:hypothetical protein